MTIPSQQSSYPLYQVLPLILLPQKGNGYPWHFVFPYEFKISLSGSIKKYVLELN